MKRLIALLMLLATMLVAIPANAEGTRVFNNAHRPYRLMAKQYATGANVFPTADPSPDGTPLALTNAMGLSPVDGVVSVQLDSGFTAPVSLTAFYWSADSVTVSNSCWVRASNVSTTYTASVDSHYASVSFSVPGNTPWLIQSSAAVTGLVYSSTPAYSANLGSSVAGY